MMVTNKPLDAEEPDTQDADCDEHRDSRDDDDGELCNKIHIDNIPKSA